MDVYAAQCIDQVRVSPCEVSHFERVDSSVHVSAHCKHFTNRQLALVACPSKQGRFDACAAPAKGYTERPLMFTDSPVLYTRAKTVDSYYYARTNYSAHNDAKSVVTLRGRSQPHCPTFHTPFANSMGRSIQLIVYEHSAFFLL